MHVNIVDEYGTLQPDEEQAILSLERTYNIEFQAWTEAPEGYYRSLHPTLIGMWRGFVTVIIIENVPLFSFPEELKKFPHLSELHLINCQIKEIPTWINSFNYLKSLILSNNLISDLSPLQKGIRLLSYLHFDTNAVENLENLNCEHLKYIDFSKNKIDEIHSSFSRNTNLQTVLLEGNGFDHIPDAIFSLPKLESLDVGNTRISSIPKELVQIPRLVFINIGGTNIRTFSNLKKREWKGLALSHLDLESVSFLRHPNFRSLCTLYLSHNNLTDLPQCFSKFKKLSRLDLSYNNFSDVPKVIGKIPNLHRISLSTNPFSPEILQFLEDVKCLSFPELPLYWIASPVMDLTPLRNYLTN